MAGGMLSYSSPAIARNCACSASAEGEWKSSWYLSASPPSLRQMAFWRS